MFTPLLGANMTLFDKLFATVLFLVAAFALASFGLISVTLTTNPVSATLVFITYALLLGLAAWMYFISVIID